MRERFELHCADHGQSDGTIFYELGYAHARNTPTVLLARRNGTLPFDISGHRVIFYDDSIRGKPEVETALRRHLSSILGGSGG